MICWGVRDVVEIAWVENSGVIGPEVVDNPAVSAVLDDAVAFWDMSVECNDQSKIIFFA
jgi:hypothetical protein